MLFPSLPPLGPVLMNRHIKHSTNDTFRDMSFPSGTLILSNAMPRKHQGLAASLVTTTVNYSISLGLGFAGTVESHVNRGGTDELRGYRGALYMGVGLSGLGLLVSVAFMGVSWRRYRGQKKEGV